MTWQLLVLISVVSVSLSAIFQKSLMLNKNVHPYIFAAVFQLAIGLLIGIVLLFKGFNFPPLGPIVLNLVLMSILYSLGNISKFKSLKKIEASEFTVIYQASTLVTVSIAIFLMKEIFLVRQFLGLILVIFSILLVTLKEKVTFKFNSGEIWALLTAICYGAAFANDAYILRSFDVWTYTFIAFLVPGILTLLFAIKEIKDASNIVKEDNVLPFSLSVLFYTIAVITVYSAYQVGRNAAQISSINQISTILIVILAAIFLKERDRLPKKLIAAAISIMGIILLR